MTRVNEFVPLLVFCSLVAVLVLFDPNSVHAGPANAMCNPVKLECGCGIMKDAKGKCTVPGNMWKCPCSQVDNGFTSAGTCEAPNVCSSKSQDGQNGMPMLPMLPMPMPMPDMPMMPMDCGSGFGGTSGVDTTRNSTTSTSTQACPNAYTPPPSDYFNNTGYTPSNFDFTPSSSSISDLIDTTNTGSPTKFAVASSTGSNTTFVGGQVFGLTGGISGDLKIIGTAVTAFVSNRDALNNAQVSGFYGQTAPTQAAAVQVVTMMCRTRPWSSNFLSFIVPATFFDSICTLRGFPVGQPVAKKAATSSGSSSPKAKTTAPPPKPYVKPKVDVWAVPESVRSGFRTSIFWEANGVESCVVVSSDGTFSENSLSGHAPSMPLTAATTFTMTCQTATSTPAIDRVTVNIVSS